MIVIFGLADLFLEFGAESVDPYWVIWFFRSGIIIGVILLVGGTFAYDMLD